LQAVAKESALKVLELNAGKIATIAESPLGLRHGPMSFINAETLVVAFLSGNDHRLQYELDLLEELLRKKLSADMLVVAPRVTSRIAKLTKNVLSLEAPTTFPDTCRPPVDVIAGQLLGLFFAIENGITPDTPSDGAISRVVSHVKIYPAAKKGNEK
jgi:tagatose-6-phosphate ketose/aldose isomerase